VSVNNHGAPIPCMSGGDQDAQPAKPQLSPVELELKAVQYFQDKLAKKGSKLPIKSLAGHLSQAPIDMRSVVGPQSEFKSFLLKHKDIFIIDQDELVGLTDDIKNHSRLQRECSDVSLDSTTASKSLSRDSKSKPSPITMTASEYKTMKFLKELVETSGGQIAAAAVMLRVADAAEPIQNILADDITKLTNFVTKFPNIFLLIDDMITLKKTKLNVIMAGSRPSGNTPNADVNTSPASTKTDPDSMSSSIASNLSDSLNDKTASVTCTNTGSKGATPTAAYRTLSNHKGPIYHLAKLWGIVDLGKHEHVFFDRSILPDGYDDLSKKFKIGEILRFNAVRAARGSRARWRATHVWRDGEDIRSMYGTESSFTLTGFNSTGLDDEIKTLLPNLDSGAGDQYAYADATQSNTGCIPVWTVNTHPGSGDDKGVPSLSMVPESKYMQKSVAKDNKQLIPGYMLVPTDSKPAKMQLSNGASEPRTREMACQTISTGDIMATQLYQDED